MIYREEYGGEVVPGQRIGSDSNDGNCVKLRPGPSDRETEDGFCGVGRRASLRLQCDE